ncbi:MAG: biotin--[acetyl-CoA-carboxylase] ligase [Wenzhouxiangella sp.]|nr:MAG: biotin--[acetyl-CoA-carboxylase] ligase [Wenzhouxiangella sp.]
MTPTDGNHPELPLAFKAVAIDNGDCVRSSAVQRARDGAEEGTMVWSSRQSMGLARPGKAWHSPDTGLYLGLILEPEFASADTGQIALVGLVSMGLAIAEQVVPMTDLAYRWPNDILLSGVKVAGLWLDADENNDWLVLSVSVNVGQAPEGIIDAGCVQVEGGNPEITPGSLLEDFARQFLHWINRWAEEGMEPVLAQLRNRHPQAGTGMMVRLDTDETIAGPLIGLDENGALQVETSTKPIRTITLNEFFSL